MKSCLKQVGRWLGCMLAIRYLLSYLLWRAVLGRDRAFSDASSAIARMPGLLGLYTREAFYRWTCDAVGQDVSFGFMTVFSKPDIRIGSQVYFGRFCQIGRVQLGDGCMIGDGSHIPSGRHQHGRGAMRDIPLHQQPHHYQTITIGKDTWIGVNSVVMADVGERCVVAAGAVVVKPVESDQHVGGVPAKPLSSAARYSPRQAA